jgi:MtN3 and saliva related transmembrane protein
MGIVCGSIPCGTDPYIPRDMAHYTAMDTVTTIGMVAGFCTTVAFLPQVLKTWKTRRAEDLSYSMLCLFLLGLVLWSMYGIAIASLPIILANAVTIALVSFIVVMKMRFNGSTARSTDDDG